MNSAAWGYLRYFISPSASVIRSNEYDVEIGVRKESVRRCLWGGGGGRSGADIKERGLDRTLPRQPFLFRTGIPIPMRGKKGNFKKHALATKFSVLYQTAGRQWPISRFVAGHEWALGTRPANQH